MDSDSDDQLLEEDDFHQMELSFGSRLAPKPGKFQKFYKNINEYINDAYLINLKLTTLDFLQTSFIQI